MENAPSAARATSPAHSSPSSNSTVPGSRPSSSSSRSTISCALSINQRYARSGNSFFHASRARRYSLLACLPSQGFNVLLNRDDTFLLFSFVAKCLLKAVVISGQSRFDSSFRAQMKISFSVVQSLRLLLVVSTFCSAFCASCGSSFWDVCCMFGCAACWAPSGATSGMVSPVCGPFCWRFCSAFDIVESNAFRNLAS